MVMFDHRDTGTPEELWRRAEPWAAGIRLDAAEANALVVVAAHPDDETLGAAGLLAMAHRHRVPVTVIVASLGEASHPDSPTATPDELRVRRRAEVRAAVELLAPAATLHLLELPDGELLAHLPDLSDALTRILAPLPATTWVVSTWLDDGHPDHRAVALAASACALLRGMHSLGAPIWAWHWGRPDDPILPWSRARVLALDETAAASKRAALAVHRSQHLPLSPQPGDEPILSPAFLAHFDRPVEVFFDQE
jgi:LmbE family N-acetylglucosaminyl deacetylase